MPTLHVLQGPDKGRSLETSDDHIIVGRGSDQLPLTDQTVSRRHAELLQQEGMWMLTDLHSANGTYVNGQRVAKPMRLRHGDQIRMGSTVLLYTNDESLERLSGDKIPSDLVTLHEDDERPGEIVASVPRSDDSVIASVSDTADAIRGWNVLRELSDAISSVLTPSQLLARVVDIIFEQLPADRGVVFVRDLQSRELLPEVVRFRNRKERAEASREAITASRAVMNHVLETHDAVLCANATTDKRFQDSGTVPREVGRRSVVCAPIVARDQILGVIYLDSLVERHTYDETELRLLTSIGHQTGLAIENARLVQSQLERERLAAAGETVAYLSHSIKNILQGMQSGAHMVGNGIDRRDFARTAQGWKIVERNLDKCYTLMMNMLAFSKHREPQLEMHHINRIIEDVIELVQQTARDERVTLEADLARNMPELPLDYDGMHQVVLNLVSNALDAVSRETGKIRIQTLHDRESEQIILRVSDNGPGIPPDQREKVFEPFHSTKGHGGTGLGLAVVRKVVLELGGAITLTESELGGAAFVIKLSTAPRRAATLGDTQGPE